MSNRRVNTLTNLFAAACMCLASCAFYAVWAADEVLSPEADVDSQTSAYVIRGVSDSCTTDYCDQGDHDCYLDVDELPDSGDDDNTITIDAYTRSGAVYVADMEDPTNPPSQTEDAQILSFTTSECDENCDEGAGVGGSVQFEWELWCNGSYVADIWGPIARNGEDNVHNGVLWTFPGSGSGCADDGSDVQLVPVIHGYKSKTAEYISCYENWEWQVTWATEEEKRVMIVEGHP